MHDKSSIKKNYFGMKTRLWDILWEAIQNFSILEKNNHSKNSKLKC